ncbi:MAG: hypothetical protein JWO31_3321, partial [Phycisphaerales bacterium]|nr:hypothetical protein [Phycisphaerales bacterium]
MTRIATLIGPADQGRRMSLAEFDRAEGVPGFLYELSKGVITVMDVPALPHAAQLEALRDQFILYRAQNPGRIRHVFGGGESKVLLEESESERHPDLSIYFRASEEPGNWAVYIPEIVAEIISPSSRHRDYEEKAPEYLQFGVREYWIVDRPRGEMIVHRRAGGRWHVAAVKPP